MREIITCLLLLFGAAAQAGSDHHNSDSAVDASSVVSTSVSDSSRAFGLGAGDVDIAQCYRSWSVILYQDSKPNLLCVADSLDAKGLHQAAARTRCSVRAYARVFDTQDQCVLMSTVAPLVVSEPMPETVDDDDEYVVFVV